MESAELRVERQGALGIITLDRAKALNALTHEMVRAMSRQLAFWAVDDTVAFVLVRAVPGRAFCAGGDVRAVTEHHRREGVVAARRFFWDEYRLNWRIRHFPKPYLALLDGVTMGGGVGISIHGSHRLATEATLFAMPETAIGMFPDVGATYALNNLPHASPAMGLFLGLTGTRLGPEDCRALGIATHMVTQTAQGELVQRLADVPAGPIAERELAALLARHERPAGVSGPVAERRDVIERIFGQPDLPAVLAALEREGSPWALDQLENLRAASPFAVRLTAALLEGGRTLAFDDAMRLEYRVVQRVLEHGDFHEGVRALLIDKDKRPRWRDANIESVNAKVVAACMAPLAAPRDELEFDWSPD